MSEENGSVETTDQVEEPATEEETETPKEKPEESQEEAPPEEEEAPLEEEPEESKTNAFVMAEYGKFKERVLILGEMTETEAWYRFWRTLKMDIAIHAEQILDAEKAREVIQHQESVKTIRRIMERVGEPVQAFNEFIEKTSLFAQDVDVEVSWDEDLGRVEVNEIEHPEPEPKQAPEDEPYPDPGDTEEESK